MADKGAVTKQDSSTQQLRQTEVNEQHSSANAQAGLNLNLGAAVSGIFSGKSKKDTETQPDGGSHSTEETHSAAQAHGSGVGNMAAAGQAQAQSGQRQVKQADHLGIEESR